jgi:hypothetical protein
VQLFHYCHALHLMFQFVQNNNNAKSGFTSAEKEAGWFKTA